MTDIEVKKSDTTLPAQPPAAAAPARPVPADMAHCDSDTQTHPDLAAPKVKTKGEKWFDFGLYTGLNYFVNLAVSVVIADMFLHSSGRLNDVFLKCRKAAHTGLGSIMPAKMAKEWSDIAAKTATLPLGGHVVMAPVKLLEDRKKRITYWINSKFFPEEYEGKNIPIKPLSEMRDDELPEVVECPPKASWGSLINRRLLAWGAAIATNSVLDRSIRIQDKSFNHFVEDGASNIGVAHGFTRDSRADRYIKLTATDSYLTVVTAFVTRITNGTFFKDKKKAPPAVDAPLQVAAPVAQPETAAQKPVATTKKIVDMGPAASHSQRLATDTSSMVPGL